MIFWGAFSFFYFNEKLPQALFFAYALLNITTFLAYALDKHKAKRGKWRIKESTLHLFSLLGGWSGAAIAQKLFRHKSIKVSFRRAYWLTVVINLSVLLWGFNTELDFSRIVNHI